MITADLKKALHVYRAGLRETGQLVTEQGPYGMAAGAPVALAYVDAIAELVLQAYDARELLEAQDLGWVIRQLDVSGQTDMLRGGPVDYLSSIIGKAYVRWMNPDDVAGDAAPKTRWGVWLNAVLLSAGYHQDEVDTAWQRVLRSTVATTRRTQGEHPAELQKYFLVPVAELIDLMPPSSRDRIIDADETLAAELAQLGLGMVEMVSATYIDEDGVTHEDQIPRAELDQSVDQAIRDALMGHVPTLAASPFQHRVSRSSSLSLLVQCVTWPTPIPEPPPQVVATARLWVQYLQNPDCTNRDSAWAAGRSTLEDVAASEDPVEASRAASLLPAWLEIRPQLLSDEPEAHQSAGRAGVDMLMSIASVVVRSLGDAASYDVSASEAILRLVTPHAVADWLALPERPWEPDLPSLLKGAAAAWASGPEPQSLERIALQLTSPFTDAAELRGRLLSRLASCSPQEWDQTTDSILSLAERTESASLATNLVLTVAEAAAGNNALEKQGQLRDRVAAVVAEVFFPPPAGGPAGRDLTLEYSLAAWLYGEWMSRAAETAGWSFEDLAYLAIRGSAFLVASASANRTPDRPPAAVVALRRIVADPTYQLVAWHCEPDEHDYVIHPVRGKTLQWSAGMLLWHMSRMPDFFTEFVADADIGESLLGLARALWRAQSFSMTTGTRRTWLDSELPETPSEAAISLLLAARGHVIERWDDRRKAELVWVAKPPDESDATQLMLDVLASGDGETAHSVMFEAAVMGPIGWTSWLHRLCAIAGHREALTRVQDDELLLGQLLFAVSVAACTANRLGTELPEALTNVLVPASDLADHAAPLHIAWVAQAVCGGAHLPSVQSFLSSALRSISDDAEAAANSVRQLAQAVSVAGVSEANKMEIHQALREIAKLGVFAAVPELSRYREG